MKEITMDYEAYQTELEEEFERGFEEGMKAVGEWLESGKSLFEFFKVYDDIRGRRFELKRQKIEELGGGCPPGFC